MIALFFFTPSFPFPSNTPCNSEAVLSEFHPFLPHISYVHYNFLSNMIIQLPLMGV